MLTFVVDKDGMPLMPTYNIKKVRKYLASGKMRIFRHEPFTVQLTYEVPEQEAPHTQPVEMCFDTGKEHIGISVKSEKHEYVHAQFDNLPDEKQRHDDARKYRKARRNRKRHREPRFNNRKANKKDGWLAPSVRHAKDNHLSLYKRYSKVCPVTDVWLEAGQFDTQALEAQQKGLPLPEGKDYQHGPRYGTDTLREAVFTRDGYKCQVCGKSPFGKDKKPVILNVHHALYWKGDHTDRMSGLMTVCTKCHTPSNHKEGGKLYGLTPKVKSMAGASFMNQVRWYLYRDMKTLCDPCGVHVHLTYGAFTKRERHSRRIAKTHANDAYCIGRFRPKHKAQEELYRKRRRNERILSKFYDAKYIDIRDGKVKKAAELGCNRTNRREPRMSDKNCRPFRGHKVSKGHESVKKQRSPIPTGSLIRYHGKLYVTKGCQHYGEYVTVDGHEPIKVKEVKVIRLAGGWIRALTRKTG